MKNVLLILFIFCVGAKAQLIDVEAFETKLKETKTPQIIDVRTPGEFGGGHLPKAYNMDYRSAVFKEEIKMLRKDVPVFVYCLSGGRSKSAAEQIRAIGIKEVYELDGGWLKWTQAKKRTEGTPDAKPIGALSGADINAALKANSLLIINFSAAWCGPCVQMKPTIKKVEKDLQGKAKFLVVDADANKHLIEQYAVDEIPTFLLFKNGKQVMRAVGFMDENGFRKLINQNL